MVAATFTIRLLSNHMGTLWRQTFLCETKLFIKLLGPVPNESEQSLGIWASYIDGWLISTLLLKHESGFLAWSLNVTEDVL